MARMKSLMQMTGSIAKLSMYTLQGHEEVIVRTKGGPTKSQIKTKPQFERVRRNNTEWAGCTLMGSQIRNSFRTMNRLEDYPVTGTLNAICKSIQKLDDKNEQGRRSILLSQHRELLAGFSFSRKQVFESVLRVPVTVTIDRNNYKAVVEIPEINTGFYLYNFQNLPYFRVMASLSGVEDLHYDEKLKGYQRSDWSYTNSNTGVYESNWLSTTGTLPAMRIVLSLNATLLHLPADLTLMVCLGVEFGRNGYGNTVEAVKYAGTGKIVAVG